MDFRPPKARDQEPRRLELNTAYTGLHVQTMKKMGEEPKTAIHVITAIIYKAVFVKRADVYQRNL